jgi:hypothetical protein
VGKQKLELHWSPEQIAHYLRRGGAVLANESTEHINALYAQTAPLRPGVPLRRWRANEGDDGRVAGRYTGLAEYGRLGHWIIGPPQVLRRFRAKCGNISRCLRPGEEQSRGGGEAR